MRTTTLPLLFLGAVFVLIGCAKNAGAPARISGSISFNGQPIKGGILRFHTKEGTAYDGQITRDGTYTATDLPEGELIVTLDTEGLNPAAKGVTTKDSEKRQKMMGGREPPTGMGGSPESEGLYIKIPTKYSSPNTSPLTVTLSSGRQVRDLELKD